MRHLDVYVGLDYRVVLEITELRMTRHWQASLTLVINSSTVRKLHLKMDDQWRYSGSVAYVPKCIMICFFYQTFLSFFVLQLILATVIIHSEKNVSGC